MDVGSEPSSDSGLTLFQLEKICSAVGLHLPPAASASESSVIEAIKAYLQAMQRARPELFDAGLPLILTKLPALSFSQKEKLRVVEDILYRVRMCIKCSQLLWTTVTKLNS
jgi:phospholipid N-methyltransferase